MRALQEPNVSGQRVGLRNAADKVGWIGKKGIFQYLNKYGL
jgi:hypothetical protein